jgi:uncharacterized DUF497 family protein
MLFEWDPNKSDKIKQERGISFEDIVCGIENGDLLDELFNPNYPEQIILLVKIENYIWVIPTEQRGNRIRFITAYPSRKFTEKYL